MYKSFLCILFVLILVILKSDTGFAGEITACFTPGGDCTGEIVKDIGTAHKSLYVQAYSFTSRPIIYALINAEKRGVKVKVLLDKTQKNGLGLLLLVQNGVPVAIDSRVKIAHNKVMIIDNQEVITGSFNFTASAQKRNAENVVFIRDNVIAQKYLVNWHSREKVSYPEMRFVGIIATNH